MVENMPIEKTIRLDTMKSAYILNRMELMFILNIFYFSMISCGVRTLIIPYFLFMWN